MPGGWSGSTRRKRLPKNWHALRATVRKRDGHQCTVIENDTRCTGGADEVDHIIRDGGDGQENLTSLCSYHHGRKSSAEGNTQRWRIRQTRPAERHPGLL